MNTGDKLRAISAAVACIIAACVPWPWVALFFAFAGVVLSNFTNLHPNVPTRVLRVTLRTAPYLAPLACYPVVQPLAPTWMGVAAVLVLVIAQHLLQVRTLRNGLRPSLNQLFPPITIDMKIGESMFYCSPAFTQELLHRGFVLGLCLTANLGIPASIAISTVTFVLEHVATKRSIWKPNVRDVVTWSIYSIIFGIVVALGWGLGSVILGHLLINAPNAARPWLRRTRPGGERLWRTRTT